MRTISEIIEAAGGAKAIETASAGSVSKDAVYKWPSIGIPDRHWSILIDVLACSSAEELFRSNLAARAPSIPEAAE